MSLVRAETLGKVYNTVGVPVPAIRDVSFAIEPGAFVAFVGPSGSGKTTLLNMIGTLDPPTSGKLWVVDTDVSTLGRRHAAEFRGRHLGFVFQDFNLIPVLTAAENIEYPLLMVQRRPAAERRERVHKMLEAVGIVELADKRPDQLSGGQKQRVAVARALVTNPQLVLADEPTANLDSATAHRVIELMRAMKDQFGTTFIFSTHDPRVMAEAEVTFRLTDGSLDQGPPAGSTRHG
ncbi:MAG: ABC transporter ATP-binding protein [Candidatus Lambdaproteobacteria bacterium]|nr:ABC transporter ATP-binding protein [Candidatus Lambdaproteobacteria bacterium]